MNSFSSRDRWLLSLFALGVLGAMGFAVGCVLVGPTLPWPEQSKGIVFWLVVFGAVLYFAALSMVALVSVLMFPHRSTYATVVSGASGLLVVGAWAWIRHFQ